MVGWGFVCECVYFLLVGVLVFIMIVFGESWYEMVRGEVEVFLSFFEFYDVEGRRCVGGRWESRVEVRGMSWVVVVVLVGLRG